MEGLSGLFGWRDMAPSLRDRISADVRGVADDPRVHSLIDAGGQRVLGSTPDEFSAAIELQRMHVRQINAIIDLRNAAK